MDDIVEYLARSLFALVRLLVALIWSATELAYEKVFWCLGWTILRALSLGKFPKQGFIQENHAPLVTHFFVSLAGIAFPMAALYILALNYG